MVVRVSLGGHFRITRVCASIGAMTAAIGYKTHSSRLFDARLDSEPKRLGNTGEPRPMNWRYRPRFVEPDVFIELSKQAGLEVVARHVRIRVSRQRRLHAPSAPPPVRRACPSAPWRTGRVDSVFDSSDAVAMPIHSRRRQFESCQTLTRTYNPAALNFRRYFAAIVANI